MTRRDVGIRADHLTLARLALLPIPLAMLYGDGPAWKAAALALFVLLGLTDVWDGPLARRWGPSRLGGVLDIVADRVFLTLVYAAFADLRIVPTAVFAVLLGRDFLLAALRSLPGVAARMGAAGKLRTAVQMYGAGLLLLLSIAGPSRWIEAILVAAAIGGGAVQIRAFRSGNGWDWRAIWTAGLTASTASVLQLAPARTVSFVTALIVGFAIGTAILYVWRTRRQIAAGLSAAWWEPARVVGVTLAIPFAWLPLLREGPPLSLLIAALAAADLVRLLAASEVALRPHRPPARRELARLSLLAATGLAAQAAVRGGSGTLGIALALLACLETSAEAAWRMRVAAGDVRLAPAGGARLTPPSSGTATPRTQGAPRP
ncbi:MAG: CDP-alcohol phosphatidyltransferase family protein [Bacteroidota bacterium]